MIQRCLYLLLSLAVERLREHWEEANSKVNSRKNQLEDMLLECRQFDEMKAEFDRWIAQVEDDFESQGEIAYTVETLEKQIKELKVSSELCMQYDSLWNLTLA